MNAVRACGLIIAFGSVALALVVLRSEQARSAAAALRHEARWVAARSERWDAQCTLARLRAPAQIHLRLESFNLDIHRLGPTRIENMHRLALARDVDWNH